MIYQRVLLTKAWVFGIIILFIVISVTPSSGNLIEDVTINAHVLDAIGDSEELLLRGKTAYAWIVYNPNGGEGPCYFELDDPGNITGGGYAPGSFISGGTWTCDDRWLCCQYGTGILFEIDPETGDMWSIGGGGTSCNGLAWDPLWNRLYATDGSNLILYDPDTGEQEFIGSHCQPGKTMIALAINLYGICYTWDILFNGTSTLFTVDLWTGEATEVASMGEPLVYQQDGAFDWDTGILYLSTYYSKGQLKTCDLVTGELTLVGDFEGGAELTALAIPWYWGVPQADFIWTLIHPNPGEMILFNASDSYDPDGYITWYRWDWNNDGVFDENHTSPTSTHTFEEVGYYPVTLRIVDNDNWTDHKTKTVRVGNYPPTIPVIEGRRRFKEGEGGECSYTINSTDLDEDSVKYFIDWGDNITVETDWYESGEEITMNVSIPLEKGTYEIFNIKAIDIFGAESNWATLEVIVPRNIEKVYSLFQLLFDSFPLLERLLTLIRVI